MKSQKPMNQCTKEKKKKKNAEKFLEVFHDVIYNACIKKSLSLSRLMLLCQCSTLIHTRINNTQNATIDSVSDSHDNALFVLVPAGSS